MKMYIGIIVIINVISFFLFNAAGSQPVEGERQRWLPTVPGEVHSGLHQEVSLL